MYRIGELSEVAHVSKRTIDYYTNLGLLQAERSDSNYRYYDEKALHTLRFIEQCKKMHMPLCEIKQVIQQRQQTAVDAAVLDQVDEVSKHIRQLERELVDLKPILDRMDDEQRQMMIKHLSGRMSALTQTLLLFLI
ncbi:MerR family transcriptional regulator [Bacillus sp. 165]|uniref:MerR family transcriptional regulator n=1 Tax=Bacillus sp. 165 TaxID=1529117 RepID=UPI001AD96992|nr:MerR family transcriptional regulator [Bacillus sp. 165]